jgi:hypothetical protein
MAQLFEDEKKYPDNRTRDNFVFLGYPYNPALPRDDYQRVVRDLQSEIPIRLWYFLDEITTTEMMRKIWRAVLRADLAIFDISGGNPNVAFELGLAVAANKSCMTILKTGEPNPLGTADLGYAERAEYTSAATLKETISRVLLAKTAAARKIKEISYHIFDSNAAPTREELETSTRKLLQRVFANRRVTKQQAEAEFADRGRADAALNKLREIGVLKVEGQRRGARWVFSDQWIYHDHEVAGV